MTRVLFKIYEISSSSKQIEKMKYENGRVGDPLVQYAGESPMTSRMSTTLKTSSQMGCSRKNPHPPTDGILEILAGGGVKDSGNPGGRGG